jgi:cell division protein ZapB
MEIIETLNNKIDKLIHDYEKLRLENQSLLQELDKIKNDNDELVRNNQDMF